MIRITNYEITQKQLEFYKKGKSGCMFAAMAAKEPQHYKWFHTVINNTNTTEIDNLLQKYLASPNISTLSLIFPSITDNESLLNFLEELEKCQLIITEKQYYNNSLCYGFRIKINDKLSWVTGFGPFEFFPKTRKSPFTEISFRIKDRPPYEWVMKDTPKNILHLADMNMKDLPKERFKKLWDSSLMNTEKILGHKPNLISAAKTSFSIPLKFINNENLII